MLLPPSWISVVSRIYRSKLLHQQIGHPWIHAIWCQQHANSRENGRLMSILQGTRVLLCTRGCESRYAKIHPDFFPLRKIILATKARGLIDSTTMIPKRVLTPKKILKVTRYGLCTAECQLVYWLTRCSCDFRMLLVAGWQWQAAIAASGPVAVSSVDSRWTMVTSWQYNIEQTISIHSTTAKNGGVNTQSR